MTTLRAHARNPINRLIGAFRSRINARILARRLNRETFSSTESILGNADVDVSLTTHGKRADQVHIAIQAIGSGAIRPRTLTLWLDAPQDRWRPTPGIAALMARGLSVRFTENYGPHTKYFPHCNTSSSHVRPLVTADDDILYSVDWLKTLLRAATASGGRSIVAHRAHHIEFDGNGAIARYIDWSRQRGSVSSPRVFATGVSGVYYPTKMLDALRDLGASFRDVCPRADDIWLHAVALRTQVPVRQAAADPRDFLSIPNTQSGGLGVSNVFSDGNDEQIRRTYSASDLLRLKEGQP